MKRFRIRMGAAVAVLTLVAGSQLGLAQQKHETFNRHNNFVHTTDFRNVYAAILEKGLAVPSASILGESFPPVEYTPQR